MRGCGVWKRLEAPTPYTLLTPGNSMGEGCGRGSLLLAPNSLSTHARVMPPRLPFFSLPCCLTVIVCSCLVFWCTLPRSDTALSFLKGVKDSGSPLERKVLVQQVAKDAGLLRFICDTVCVYVCVWSLRDPYCPPPCPPPPTPACRARGEGGLSACHFLTHGCP